MQGNVSFVDSVAQISMYIRTQLSESFTVRVFLWNRIVETYHGLASIFIVSGRAADIFVYASDTRILTVVLFRLISG